MTADEKRNLAAAWRFFARIGQASSAMKKYDEHTMPLFPLPLILEAEGLLAKDMEEWR